jgi:hypothetical protein
MEFQLVQLTQSELETITVEQYYQKNLNECKNQGNLIAEGTLTSKFGSKMNIDLKGFITKQGLVVVEDWEMLENIIMHPTGADECYFSDGKNKSPAFLDENTELKCDFPGVSLNKSLKDRINQIRSEDENLKKIESSNESQEPQKYKL